VVAQVNALREIRGIREKFSSVGSYRVYGVYGVYGVGRSGERMGDQVAVEAVEERGHNCGKTRTGAA